MTHLSETPVNLIKHSANNYAVVQADLSVKFQFFALPWPNSAYPWTEKAINLNLKNVQKSKYGMEYTSIQKSAQEYVMWRKNRSLCVLQLWNIYPFKRWLVALSS